MRSRFKLTLFFLLLSATLCHAQEPDTTYIEDMEPEEASAAEATEQESTAPRAPVVYNSKVPTAAQWRTDTSDKAYGYRDKLEYTQEKEPAPQEPPVILKVLGYIFAFLTSTAGKLLMLAIVLCVAGYILYRVLTGGGRLFSRESKQLAVDEHTAVTEEDLFTANWEQRLAAAITKGDLRAATRYSYLMLLQLLQANDLIQYRQDKTNSEYYRELAGSDYRPVFRQLSRQYEAAWYGEYLPSTGEFREYMDAFNGLRNKLGRK